MTEMIHFLNCLDERDRAIFEDVSTANKTINNIDFEINKAVRTISNAFMEHARNLSSQNYDKGFDVLAVLNNVNDMLGYCQKIERTMNSPEMRLFEKNYNYYCPSAEIENGKYVRTQNSIIPLHTQTEIPIFELQDMNDPNNRHDVRTIFENTQRLIQKFELCLQNLPKISNNGGRVQQIELSPQKALTVFLGKTLKDIYDFQIFPLLKPYRDVKRKSLDAYVSFAVNIIKCLQTNEALKMIDVSKTRIRNAIKNCQRKSKQTPQKRAIISGAHVVVE